MYCAALSVASVDGEAVSAVDQLSGLTSATLWRAIAIFCSFKKKMPKKSLNIVAPHR